MVLVPHPDDETIGMGSTMAALADAGVHIHLLLLTDGSLSRAGALGALSSVERASLRHTEFQSAIGCISQKISFSGPVCIEEREIKSDAKDEASRLATQLSDELRPKAIFSPPPFDFHPHHVFASEVAKTLVEADTNPDGISLFYYEVQAPFAFQDPWIGIIGDPIHAARYDKAIECHESQAQSIKNAARLKKYRKIQAKTRNHIEVFLEAGSAPDRHMHTRGLSNNTLYDLRLLRGKTSAD